MFFLFVAKTCIFTLLLKTQRFFYLSPRPVFSFVSFLVVISKTEKKYLLASFVMTYSYYPIHC